MPAEPRCPHCQEPVAATARACPHCRNATFADLRIDAPVEDSRARYQIARALPVALPGAPGVSAAQAALAVRGGRLLRGALPGLAQSCAAILAERGVAHTLEPAAASEAATSRPKAVGGRGVGMLVATVVVVVAAAGIALWTRGAGGRAAPHDGPRLTGAQLAERTLPSTVAIHCQGSVGTGFFVAPGQVLTNAHVVCPPGQPTVLRLPSGEEGTGQVLQSDERLDLALLQVTGIDAAPLPLGDASALRVGDRVMVVGSPKGMVFSVTQGGVSNLDRIHLGVAMIQTDAPINPGNSGGPMLDERGRVVGVISLKRLDAEGISLALPINYAYSGPQAMLASPLRQESEGFRQMAARADEQDSSDVATLQATGQRPGLMAAMPQLDQTIAAEIWWPAPADPGSQSFDFDLVSGTTPACSLHADVSQWRKAQTKSGGSILKPRVKDWLDRHGFSSDIWVTVAVMGFNHCSDEAVGSGVVLRMHGADDDASEIQF